VEERGQRQAAVWSHQERGKRARVVVPCWLLLDDLDGREHRRFFVAGSGGGHFDFFELDGLFGRGVAALGVIGVLSVGKKRRIGLFLLEGLLALVGAAVIHRQVEADLFQLLLELLVLSLERFHLALGLAQLAFEIFDFSKSSVAAARSSESVALAPSVSSFQGDLVERFVGDFWVATGSSSRGATGFGRRTLGVGGVAGVGIV